MREADTAAGKAMFGQTIRLLGMTLQLNLGLTLNETKASSSGRGTPPSHEIAVVGIGCRFPGRVESPEAYWRLLRGGVDAISETPPDRWDLSRFYFPNEIRPGKTQSRWGGYVSGIDQFDPQLFGISPKEAASMDPQQRMLLEVAWRAMEDAGQPINQLAGRNVAVYVGISSFDYAVAALSYADRGVVGSYCNTGSSSSIAANRVSYCFDLRGPSLAVDTACSSSLVALHLACESLTRGESEMALCGGVNALLLPDFYVGFSQLGVLSPDGRCKTFDARANGYVRSEGAGMVLLKPLAAALQDRDRIYCVIRGTATNQDGYTQGLTVPSAAAQERLIRAACQAADIRPTAVQYVEAHGTGTPVGDPIEASALGAVFGMGRLSDDPCLVGSVKTNIGHLEAGAGIASLIKVALAIHHREIPPHLNLESINPEIDFEALRLLVPREVSKWPHPETRLLAGINGFGYGGANAHVILDQDPRKLPSLDGVHATSDNLKRQDGSRVVMHPGPAEKNSNQVPSSIDAKEARLPVVLPVSARSPSALTETAAVYARFLRDPGLACSMSEIAGAASHRRDHFEYRRAVMGHSIESWAEQLEELADELENTQDQWASRKANGLVLDRGLLFVCCGQGTQWWGMGRGLYASHAKYRETIDRCDREFSRHVSWSLKDELMRDSGESRMQETSIAQPALFALQISLDACWSQLGIRPAAVVGHSVGEIAAAHISGALSFEDACLVAVQRGRTMDLASSGGAMIAVGLTKAECQEWIAKLGLEIAIAAINGPTSATLSGSTEDIDAIAAVLDSSAVFCKRLPVQYAFHSVQMDPVRDELLNALASIQPRETDIDLISTVTGETVSGKDLHADYWWQNVRQGVRFADAIEVASSRGLRVAIELGPHPTLSFAINECCQSRGNQVKVLPSLRREQSDETQFIESVAALYQLGLEIDWRGIYDLPGKPVSLPPYPFQRQRLWTESDESRRTRLASGHPLLGARLGLPIPTWRSRIDLDLQTMFRDHCVRGNCLLPAAAMVEATLAALRSTESERPITLSRFRFHRPGLLTERKAFTLQTTYDRQRRQIVFSSQVIGEEDWVHLSSVDVVQEARPIRRMVDSITEVRQTLSESFSGEQCYSHCRRLGLEYGEQFRGILGGWRSSGEALADVEIKNSESFQYQQDVDPALLDSCFHAMIVADPNFDQSVQGLFLPSEIERIQFLQPVSGRALVHVRIREKTERRLVADLDIIDERGDACLLIRGFRSQRVVGGGQEETIRDWLYAYRWVPTELASTGIVAVEDAKPNIWCVMVAEDEFSSKLIKEFERRGERTLRIEQGEQFRRISTDQFALNPEKFSDVQQLLEQAGINDRDSSVHWLYLWGLDVPTNEVLDAACLEESTRITTLGPMHLVQAWSQRFDTKPARLTVLTSQAQSLDDRIESVQVASMPLVGMTRVIISELAAFQTRLIDLPRELSKSSAKFVDQIVTELTNDVDREDEVMYRNGVRYAHRFGPNHDNPLPSDTTTNLKSRLEVGEANGITDLRYRTYKSHALLGDEVEIEVIEAGLNFSDVMKALHLYPSDHELPPQLGSECAGRIIRVGEHVSEFEVGDEVMAVAPGAFSTHVVTSSHLVALKPSNLSFEQAAAVPIAFLTATHALEDCARIREGETLLVHAASGGVGLAALQLARACNVRVFATAGNPEKRAHVAAEGAELVMDSRSLRFADEVLEATSGEGVDVILNSLPGEAIPRGLSCLRVGGRFLEIGKRDIYDDQPLGMYPLRNNLALFAIDLDQLFKRKPETLGVKLRQIAKRIEQGELQPLPVSTWNVQESDQAFRFMQQSKQIGKVVVRYDSPPTPIYAGKRGKIKFSGQGTYWIVGGLGGFGLEVAKWFANHGVRTLVLSGRSTALTDEASQAIQALEASGVSVHVLPVDVADATEVERAVDRIKTELPPLLGVVHAAMVLEDRLLVDLDQETLRSVLRPKVLGGWNLHRATLGFELDHFILFSSLSSVFGHAGQANYSAANALLDGLAVYRRSIGLAACVINWGHLGEVGYLARREELSDRLRRQGVLSFSVEQAFLSLEHVLLNHLLQTSVLRMDWSLWRGLGISGDVSPRFAHLIHQIAKNDQSMVSAEQIRFAKDGDRGELVEQFLRVKVGSLLGIQKDQLDRNRSFVELGLDSLMAVELRNWIESQLEVSLPIGQLMRDTATSDLVDYILDQMKEEGPSQTNSADPESINEPATQRPEDLPSSQSASDFGELDASNARQVLKELPGMPADEVANLLSQMLREQESSTDDRS
ncbi:MAG: type I polyketide synthase [Rubripirellula sp.]|nr:type I polyketide synthase [Rubripirellula sp.]